MDSSSNQCITEVHNQRRKLSIEQLKTSFDLKVMELNEKRNLTIDDYCKIIDELKQISGLTLINSQIVNNELFRLLQLYLIDILNKWSKSNISLSDREEYFFHEIIKLFSQMIMHLNNNTQAPLSDFQSWFLDGSFLQTICSVLEDISMYSNKYINQTQTQNIECFSKLIQSIKWFQSDNDEILNNPNVLLLIDPIIKCLCSSTYIDTLKSVEIKSTNLSAYENFILVTCPAYCAWYRGKAQITMINCLCVNNMLNSYQDIYDLFLSKINDWQYSLMESMYYMTALLRYVAFYPSTREYLKKNLRIIDSMLIILNSKCLLDNILTTTRYNSETNLMDSAISFIFNLIQDFDMLNFVKENEFFCKEIFLKLIYAQVDRVKLHALMILSKILDEQDIQNLDHIDGFISVFVNYLSRAVNDPCHTFQDVPIEHLLTSLKGMFACF